MQSILTPWPNRILALAIHETGRSPGTAPPAPPSQPTTANIAHADLGKTCLVLPGAPVSEPVEVSLAQLRKLMAAGSAGGSLRFTSEGTVRGP